MKTRLVTLDNADVVPFPGGTSGVTRAWYKMQGGGCRRMAVQRKSSVDRKWVICEWPYEPGDLCEQHGEHPHQGGGKSTRPKRRPA